MLQRIGPRDKNDDRSEDQIRREFDNSLGVGRWPVPGSAVSDVPEVERPAGTPDWWTDDEEASQSFLREMGVAL